METYSNLNKIILTDLTWKLNNEGMANVFDPCTEAGLPHHCLSLLCSDWLTYQSVSGGGLKYGGLIKADYKGGECAGISLWSPQWWLHHGSAAAASSSLSLSSICSHPTAWMNNLLTGKILNIRDRDDVLCCCYCFDLSWLSNLWLLTCSAQRLTMHFCCVVYQGLCWLWHLFKAALNYFCNWVQWNK